MTLTTEYQLIGSVQQGSAYGATYYQGIYAKYSRTSQQELNNKSTIYIKMCAWNNQSISDYYATGYWIGTINGLFSDSYRVYTTVSGGVAEADRTIMWASSIEVTHNNDGTYSTSIGATNVDAPLSDSVASTIASTTLTLPTIPRAATLTASEQGTIGNYTGITIRPTVQSFLYILNAKRNSQTQYITSFSSHTSSYYYMNLELPLALYTLLQDNELYADITLELTTYSGSNVIGTSTAPFRLYANPNYVPNIEISSIDTGKTIIDTTKTTLDLTGDNTGKTIINNWNSIESVWLAGARFSTISEVSINNNIVTTSPSTLNDVSGAIAITATDARNFSRTLVEDDLTFIPYEYPSIVPTIKRNTSTDGHVNLTFTGMFYNIDFGAETNALTLEWYVKEKGSSTYTQGNTPLTYTINSDNTTYNETATISLVNPIDQVDGLFDYNKIYEFKFVATDKITTYTIENVVLTKGIPNFVVFKNALVANGKRVDPDGLLDLMHPVGEVYTTTNASFNPNTAWGGTWVQLSADAYLKIVTSSAGNTGGTSSQHKIPVESMPSHTHTFTGSQSTTNENGAHTHPVYNDNISGGNDGLYITSGTNVGSLTYMASAGSHTHTVTANGSNSNTGGGQAYYPYYYGVYAWHRTA